MSRKRKPEHLKKEKVTIRVEKGMLDKIKKEEENFSKFVNDLIKEYMESRKGNID